MITETKGNLLEAKTETLVNAVNCVGVMGKGIALEFKKKFPADYFSSYKIACLTGELAIGKVQVYELKNASTMPRYIINFPTKNHWREKSKIEDIESGLQSFVEAIDEYEIKSIAMPALGCGLGGLDFQKIRLLIEKAFKTMPDIEVLLFVPRY